MAEPQDFLPILPLSHHNENITRFYKCVTMWDENLIASTNSGNQTIMGP